MGLTKCTVRQNTCIFRQNLYSRPLGTGGGWWQRQTLKIERMIQYFIALWTIEPKFSSMKDTLSTPWFSLNPRDYDPEFYSEHVDDDNRLAFDVAGPLFRAGMETAAITCRRSHSSSRKYKPGCHNIRLLLQGRMMVELNDKTFHMLPGDLAYCPPDTMLYYATPPDTVAWWLYFKITDIPAWEKLKRRGPFVERCDSGAMIFILLRRILDANRSRDLNSMISATSDSQVLLQFLRQLSDPERVPDSRVQALRELVDDIANDPTCDWTQGLMAKRLCVSPRTMLRLFRDEYGCSPADMVARQRLNRAIYLLSSTEDSIEIIAEGCGYANPSSFSRAFSKHIGLSPGKYRQKARDREG